MPGAVRANRDIFGLGGRVVDGACQVLINGSPAVRKGDIVIPHPGKGKRHKTPSPVIEGECQILVDGRPMVRQGHMSACLDPAVTGSCDVLLGTGTSAATSAVGTINRDGRTLYQNNSTGINALILEQNRIGPGLSGYHEDTPAAGESQTAPAAIVVPPEGCKKSKHFRLADSKMPIQAQNGLTRAQIECNWIALCSNILDRLVDEGFKFSINSGFRTTEYNAKIGGSNNSDHSIGCAVDISLGSQDANRRVFRVLLNRYPYSQLIFEGNWIHIAYNGRGPKGESKVMYTLTGQEPIISAGASGQLLPADLKA